MQTWYILKDGTFADPNECAPDEKGVLRHAKGMEVAVGDHGNPMTRQMSDDDVGKGKRAKSKAPPAPEGAVLNDEDYAKATTGSREATSDESKAAYKTRDAKKG